MKNTEELLAEIMQSAEISDFFKENEKYITNLSLIDYFNILIDEKQVRKKDVIKKSAVNQTYGYQILDGTKKSPSKDKLIQLCFGMGATVEEANRILALANAGTLYSKNRRDCIIIFALNKGLTIYELNDLLFELDEKTFDL
ncbi:MAG: XRE family transcriptional regulator [Firmicutes bacterium]|nr:XRE family transcriptional regulator [Bacillota bacterium]